MPTPTTSYMFLNSMFRDRNQYPNPADFVIKYTNQSNGDNPLQVSDYVSRSSPLLFVDMNSTFTGTTAPSFPYEWERSATILAPTVNSTVSSFTVQFAGNPDIPSGTFDGLFVVYNDGFTTQTAQIAAFVNLNNTNYLVQIASTIDFVATATVLSIRTTTLTSTLLYIPTSSVVAPVPNYYINAYVYDYVNNQQSRIISYNPSSRLLVLETPLTVIPTQFLIANTTTFQTSTVSAVSPTGITVNNPDYYWQGQYLVNLRNQATAQVLQATGGVLTLRQPADLSQFIIGDQVLLLSFSMDNDVPMVNVAKESGPFGPVCHDVQLISLTLPNLLLAKYPGGYLVNYPYVLVDLINITAASTTGKVFYTNDPNLQRALFICPVQDIASPEFSAFVKLNGIGVSHTIKFKMNDSFRLTIRTPTGEPLFFTTLDTRSPYMPDPAVQVSAIFATTPSP